MGAAAHLAKAIAASQSWDYRDREEFNLLMSDAAAHP